MRWTYTIEDNSIRFNTLGPATLALCGEDSSDQIFLAKLGVGGTWSVEDGRLVLELNENAGMMVFDNGGPAKIAPETTPETGGALVVAPWAVTLLGGLAALGAGVALRRRDSHRPPKSDRQPLSSPGQPTGSNSSHVGVTVISHPFRRLGAGWGGHRAKRCFRRSNPVTKDPEDAVLVADGDES